VRYEGAQLDFVCHAYNTDPSKQQVVKSAPDKRLEREMSL